MSEKRVKFMGICFFVLCAGLCVRLGFICTINGDSLETMAQRQQIRSQSIRSVRGDIKDIHGKSFTYVTDHAVSLMSDGSLKMGDGGLFIFKQKSRAPHLARHLIGYTNAEGEGKSGLELSFDTVLKGYGQESIFYVADATGRPVGGYGTKCSDADSSASLRLTLDYDIQSLCESVMDRHIKKGAIVIMDCESFDVLAMASRPNFDAQNIESYIGSDGGELLNRALMPYNAGSVFKIVTSAAALELRAANEQRQFNCMGNFGIEGGHVFPCHKKDGHGLINFSDAFAKSCNCAFYLLGVELGGKAISDMAEGFGFGQILLGSYLGEQRGNIPKREQYSYDESMNLAIGQGEILVSPLQCASMVATVANGGIRRAANITDSLTLSDGTVLDLRQYGEKRVISQDTAERLQGFMRACVESGTASAISDSGLEIFGKTGSAESGWVIDGKPLVHGWFCAILDSGKRKYAIAILSEGGKSGAKSCLEPFLELARGL